MRSQPALHIQGTIDKWRQNNGALGLNVGISVNEAPSLSLASGFQAPNRHDPLAANQTFYIYSITKTFVSVAILKLIEQGKLSLDASVSQFFPNRALNSEIKVLHLLNHTSGLPEYTMLEQVQALAHTLETQALSDDEILDLVLDAPSDFKPGQGWRYSNTGYMLLRMLIESITGKRFAEALQALLLRPLELCQSHVVTEKKDPQVTSGFSNKFGPDDQLIEINNRYDPNWVKTGLVASTVCDVTRFYSKLFQGAVLQPATLDDMIKSRYLATQGATTHKPLHYGFGIDILCNTPGQKAFGHGGGGPGFTLGCKYLERDGQSITIAIFCNSNLDAPMFPLFDEITETLLTSNQRHSASFTNPSRSPSMAGKDKRIPAQKRRSF